MVHFQSADENVCYFVDSDVKFEMHMYMRTYIVNPAWRLLSIYVGGTIQKYMDTVLFCQRILPSVSPGVLMASVFGIEKIVGSYVDLRSSLTYF